MEVRYRNVIEWVTSKQRLSHILIKIEVRSKRSSSVDSLSIFGTDTTLGLMIAEKSRLKNRHSQCKKRLKFTLFPVFLESGMK